MYTLCLNSKFYTVLRVNVMTYSKKMRKSQLINKPTFHWIVLCVTYWPSTELSIKKQVHLVKDIGISPWPVDGLNSEQMRRPEEAGGRLSKSITKCHGGFELVGVRVAVQFQSQFPAEWEPAPDRWIWPSRPRLSSPEEWGRSAAMVRGTWGQYVAVSFRLQLTSRT